MRKRIAVVLAALGLALSLSVAAAPAHATIDHKRIGWGSGQFSGDEFDAINYQNYKSTVENGCNCTGTYQAFISGGTTHKDSEIWFYNNTWTQGGVSIAYYITDGGSKRVYRKDWCRATNANGDLTQCGPSTYWQLPLR